MEAIMKMESFCPLGSELIGNKSITSKRKIAIYKVNVEY